MGVMKNSRKIEILEATIEGLKNDSNQCVGICYHSAHNKANSTLEEDVIIRRYIDINKPCKNKHSEFYIHGTFQGKAYWWQLCREGHAQRILFLEKLIEELKLNWFEKFIKKIFK